MKGFSTFFILGMSYPLEVCSPLQGLILRERWASQSFDLCERGEASFKKKKLTLEDLSCLANGVLRKGNSMNPVHLVSLSNSDWVTQVFANRFPQKVVSISLIAPSGFDKRTQGFKIRALSQLRVIHRWSDKLIRNKISERMENHLKSDLWKYRYLKTIPELYS